MKRRWTDQELQALRENAGKLAPVEIGRLVGRPASSVQAKAARMGISLEGYRKTLACLDCGTPVVIPWQANETKVRCPVCRERHNKKRLQDYNMDKFSRVSYSGNRGSVYERDGYKCRLCGSRQNLVIHHINERSYHNSDEPDNDMDNLTTLCNSCHARYHLSKERKKHASTVCS